MMYKCKDKNIWEYICHQTYYLYIYTYLYHQIKTFIAWFITNLFFLLNIIQRIIAIKKAIKILHKNKVKIKISCTIYKKNSLNIYNVLLFFF